MHVEPFDQMVKFRTPLRSGRRLSLGVNSLILTTDPKSSLTDTPQRFVTDQARRPLSLEMITFTPTQSIHPAQTILLHM